MSKHEIASLACKILGVYMIIQGISVFVNIITATIIMQDLSASTMLVNVIFPFAFLIIFGAALWILSDKLSAFMVNKESHTKEELGIRAQDLQRVAFSIIGLLLIGTSLPKLISTLVNLIELKEMAGSSTNLLPRLSGDITQLIVGLGIFIGSQGLINLLERIRNSELRNERELRDED